ncbi:MAG: phage capsid protein [Nevskia sp.]|nr:phage capsid protein [Nevskia sp.]
MSFEVTTNFVQQFRSTLAMLAQQKKSRFRDKVIYEPVTGQTTWYDQVGTSEANDITNRQGDTPLANTPHRRRRIDLAPKNWADLIDNADKVRMLADPTSTYTRAGNAAMNRKIDSIIYNAFFATANTGADGSTPVAFPSANQIAVNSWAYGTGSGNAGLTISKLIEAKVTLWGQEAVDDADEQQVSDLYIAVTGKQLGNLLATTEVTSKDYNEVAALAQGKISDFMGFKFVRYEKLAQDSNSYWRVPVWQKEGMYLGIAEDLTLVDISRRADKNMAWQPYYEMTMGSARVEEARVVEIKCA